MASKAEGDRAGVSWKHVKIGGTTPSTRYSQATALLEGKVYVFGGASSNDDGSTAYHDDFFSFDLTRTPLEWVTIECKGAVPSAREGASLNVADSKLYLHGGVESEAANTCADGLFVFIPDEGVWEQVQTSGLAPTAQSSSTVTFDKKLLTFGGIVNGKAVNSLHLLDLCTSEWTEVKTSGATPPARCDHAAAVVGGKMIMTFGSGSDELWFNDVHVLDLDTWQWSLVDSKGVAPSPRDYATVTAVANRYVFQFGGFSGEDGEEKCFADIHYVDCSLRDFEWHSVDIADDSHLPARYAHSALSYKDKLYVLGGQNTEEEFNDVWVVSIPVPSVSVEPVPVPKPRYSTATPIPAPRKVVAPAPPLSPKPRDLDELRNCYVKKINEIFDVLTEKFQQLDLATATLESERAAFEAEKKAQCELYDKQQQELDAMLKHHKQENEEWVSHMHSKMTSERQALAEEKAAAAEVSARLTKEQEIFQQKSNKLDAIMRQVQGLKD